MKNWDDLPIAFAIGAPGEENWLEVIVQVLRDEDLIKAPTVEDDYIDLDSLFRSENTIENLVLRE